MILIVQETERETASDLKRFVCRYERGEIAQIIEAVNHVSFVHKSQPAGHAHLLGDCRHRQSCSKKETRKQWCRLRSNTVCHRPMDTNRILIMLHGI